MMTHDRGSDNYFGRRMPMSLPLRAAMALVVAGLAIEAQARPQQPDGAPTKRAVYFVKNVSAPLLASVLDKHYRGSGVHVVAEEAGNALLIGGSAALVEDVLATVQRLDRRPQSVAIEITLVQVAPKKGADGKFEPGPLDDQEFSGPAERVQEHLQALQKQGVVTTARRFTLRALEQMPAELENGQVQPNATGGVGPGGFGAGGKKAKGGFGGG